MTNSYELDGLDKKILKELFKDARAKVSDIAKKIKVPHATVYMRIKNMEKGRLIKGYIPKLRACDLGKPMKCLVEIKTKEGEKAFKIWNDIKSLKNMTSFYSVTGEADYVAIICGEDIEKINKTLMQIRGIAGVKSTTTHIVLDIFREHDLSRLL